MKNLFTVVLLAPFFFATNTWADASIKLSTDQQPVTIYVKDNRMQLVAAASDSQVEGEAIYDEASDSLIIVDHANQSLFNLDAQTIEKVGGTIDAAVSAVQQQLKNLPEEQRGSLQDLISGFGLAIPEESTPELRLSQASARQYQGIECQEHQVLEGKKSIATICVTQGNSLGISDQDYFTLLAAQRFMLNAASQATQLAEQYGQKIPNFGDIQLSGVLVHSQQSEPYDKTAEQPLKASFAIEKISTEAVSPIAPPSGYQKKSFPF